MLDSISGDVLAQMKRHILTQTDIAERSRHSFFEKEDAITASLLNSLKTPNWQKFDDKKWRVQVYQNGNFGENAESKIGADGIIQIAVYGKDGLLLETKGLLFQAKKTTDTRRSKLDEQIEKMQQFGGKRGCAVFVYDIENGFRGVNASDLQNQRLKDENLGKRLNQFIADDFLDCSVGEKGLYYSQKNKMFYPPDALPIVLERKNLKYILSAVVNEWFGIGAKK